MKKFKNNDGIAGWKIDSCTERFLSRWADKSNFGKYLYVSYYKLFDREYYQKGLEFIKNNIKMFIGDVTEKQLKEYTYDMVYSLHRFGCMFDEYFLMNFPNLNVKGREAFITDKIRWDYYARMNLDENKELFNNKKKAYDIFGRFYKRELIEIVSDDDCNEFEKFIEKHERFIVKPIDGSGGKGIYVINTNDYATKEELFKEVRKNGSVVLEELIEQSDSMKIFNSNSVNTVRIPTLKLKEKVVIFHPFFRTGRGGSIVDNAANGGIFAAVDSETGICISKGIDERGNSYIKHPVTGNIYLGFQIPRWDEAIQLVTELANVVEGNHYVGWDVALTDDGWVMVEGNPRGQLIEQYATGKGIKEELEYYISQM